MFAKTNKKTLNFALIKAYHDKGAITLNIFNTVMRKTNLFIAAF